MYKTILVHVEADDPGTPARVQCAAALAHDFHATLIGAAAALPLAMIELHAAGATALAAGIVTGEPGELDDRFAAAKAEFDRWTADTGVQTAWRTVIDFPTHAMITFSARADLIVCGAPQPSPANSYLDTADLVMRAGRPVLVVPRGMTNLDPRAAIVAWRNTREARRALADALPLLGAFGEVTLVHAKATGEAAYDSLHDAQGFLSGHCIGASTKEIECGHRSVGEAIAEFAETAQAGLVVAGAYGHTRVREWVFGGVTHDLMSERPFARLFSR